MPTGAEQPKKVYLRIEGGLTNSDTKIYVVDEDNNEFELQGVTGCVVDIKIGHVNTATLEVMPQAVNIKSVLDMVEEPHLELIVLKVKVDIELTDPDLINRTHGTASCYNGGKCRGPLCTYERRLHQRTPGAAGVLNPRLEEYLQERIEAHHTERAQQLANRRRTTQEGLLKD